MIRTPGMETSKYLGGSVVIYQLILWLLIMDNKFDHNTNIQTSRLISFRLPTLLTNYDSVRNTLSYRKWWITIDDPRYAGSLSLNFPVDKAPVKQIGISIS